MTDTDQAAPSWQTRTAWFREARYGLFVHWGLYAIPGRGEWIMYKEKIPAVEYEKLADEFKPGAFDPDAWVALAREAGMKYINFTSKHHDGFCTFDSALTDYTSVKRAAGRDLCAELAEACGRAEMPLFFYHSLPDWHHPDAADVSDSGRFDFTMGRTGGEWDRYVEYLHGQVRELCTNYGRVAGLWFDMGVHWTPAHWRADELCATIRELQPHALINNRTGRPEDFGTPEEYIPGSAAEGASTMGVAGESGPDAETPAGREGFFEVCLTTTKGAKAGNWGYNPEPAEIMSADEIVANVRRINGLGGNLLLNVGPDPDGRIPEAVAASLREAGAQLRTESADAGA